MAQSKSPIVNMANFVPVIFVLLFLCLGFIPNLGAVDKIAPQWLSMSILNLLSAAYILSNRKAFSIALNTTLSSVLSLVYVGFILWAALSYFYAINPTEVIVNIVRQFNVLLMYLHMGIFIYNLKSRSYLISFFITAILAVEVYAVLNQAIGMIKTSGIVSPGSLKGVTANRNITAFSLAIKIPFVLFLIYRSNKLSFKLLLGALIFFTLLSLSMIQSRASFLAVGLILIAVTIMGVALYLNDKKDKRHLFYIGYYAIPLLLAIVVNQSFVSNRGADALARAATISINTSDGSVNQRLRYYNHVLTHMKSNPIWGTGLGNWKLKSIDYDKRDMRGYIVPYHAHSDFIQLGAELGVIGFILYLGVFVIVVFFAVQLIRKSNLSIEQKVFVFLLLTALGVYCIDANLNFPIARPQVLVVWTMIIALINFYYQTENFRTKEIKSTKLSFIIPSLAFLLLLPCIYVANLNYRSLKGQGVLLFDFNSRKHSVPMDKIDHLIPDIPNITVTTIPMKVMIARYYVNAKKYDKALELLDQAPSANPFLHIDEFLKSRIYDAKGIKDSTLIYAKKAYFGLPNNSLHFLNLIRIINEQKDKKSLEEVFEVLAQNNVEDNWKNYLAVASTLHSTGDKTLMERSKKAVELFPKSKDIRNLHRLIAIGQKRINEGNAFYKVALEMFNKENYALAARFFENAIFSNPYEYAYRENAATAYYLLKNYPKALEHIDVVIDQMNPGDGKCEYIKGIVLVSIGTIDEACSFLKTALEKGYEKAQQTLKQNCN